MKLDVSFSGGTKSARYTVERDRHYSKDSFALPDQPLMKMCFRIKISGDLVTEEKYPELWQSLAISLQEAPAWGYLNYSASGVDAEGRGLMTIQLEDKALDQQVAKILEGSVVRLKCIVFNLSLNDSKLASLDPMRRRERIKEHLNDLVFNSVWYALQSHYPFCFSWLARTEFKASYGTFRAATAKYGNNVGTRKSCERFMHELDDGNFLQYMRSLSEDQRAMMKKPECMLQFWKTSEVILSWTRKLEREYSC